MAKKKTEWVWVANPQYEQDYCANCQQHRCNHFEIITPTGVALLCETPQQYEDMNVGEYKQV